MQPFGFMVENWSGEFRKARPAPISSKFQNKKNFKKPESEKQYEKTQFDFDSIKKNPIVRAVLYTFIGLSALWLGGKISKMVAGSLKDYQQLRDVILIGKNGISKTNLS